MPRQTLVSFLLLFLPVWAFAQYTITNQQPTTEVPYPEAFFSKKLPNAGRGGPSQIVRDSDKVIAETLTRAYTDENITMPKIGGYSVISTPGADDGNSTTFYYATASDPIYRVRSCRHPPYDPNKSPVGKLFHAPSAAESSGNCLGRSSCSNWDARIDIWDQTSDATFGTYYGHGDGQGLPACNSHDPAHPCDLEMTYCGWANWKTADGYDAGSINTNGLPPYGGKIRMQELREGSIHHALYLDTFCTDDEVVWPASQGGWTAMTCKEYQKRHPGFQFRYRPKNGSLVFLDYTDSQLAELKKALPVWQYPVIEAMTYYGGYIGDTGSYGGIFFAGFESGQPYKYYQEHGVKGAWNVAESFYGWLKSNCNTSACQHVVHYMSPPKSHDTFMLFSFQGIPPIGGKGIVEHMHIADACVAKGLAGLQGGCIKGEERERKKEKREKKHR